ncbi:cupin domain-containing protein [Mesorhizobium ciceri]|uniref:cupin domain-containing protein n=1 Tax=Mesorhizobium TaxID=68287 RepID=UPI0004AE77AF|nr:cupin domain-containing protein [Mesorhizobium ciceri]
MDNTNLPPAPSGIHVSGTETRESYWQPVPANGHIDVALAPHIVGMEHPFALGTQSVAPGGYVREHTHDRNEETVYVIEGHGRAVIDGKEYPLEPDSVVFLPKNVRHMFINDGDTRLRWIWLIVPNGLEDFFRLIGKPRKPGDRVPSNFPRPENVLEIERKTVFGADLADKFDPLKQNP